MVVVCAVGCAGVFGGEGDLHGLVRKQRLSHDRRDPVVPIRAAQVEYAVPGRLGVVDLRQRAFVREERSFGGLGMGEEENNIYNKNFRSGGHII